MTSRYKQILELQSGQRLTRLNHTETVDMPVFDSFLRYSLYAG